MFIAFEEGISLQHMILHCLDAGRQVFFCFFCCFDQVQGRGSKTGEPHYGSHAWPGQNSAIITMCEDDRVKPILGRLKKIDEESPMLGLRAFVLPVEEAL